MPTLEQFKTKYASVLDMVRRRNVRLDHLHVEGEKLVITGAAPSEEVRNEVWNQIKAVDPLYADLQCQIDIDPSLPPPVRTHTVVAGDSLWKIARKHLGNGAAYPRIIQANPGKLRDDKSVIHPGDVLVIPEP